MNVNPFSYLIEKLKSKADKSEIPDEKSVKNYYDSRPNSANVKFGDGRLRQFKATGQMTTGKPMDDGHIVHLAWDSSGDGDAELYIPNGTSGKMQYRVQNGGTWQNWSTVALTSDINPVDVSSEFTPDSCIDSFKAYRSGKIITLDATLKAQSYSSGQQLFTSTNAVKPVVSFAVTLTDSNNKPEQSGVVWIQTSNQHRYFGDSMSGKHYFTATYISQ